MHDSPFAEHKPLRFHRLPGVGLRLQDRVLLRIGDEITSAREILRQPKIVNDRGAIYYVGCALNRRERITQISLEKSEKKKFKH